MVILLLYAAFIVCLLVSFLHVCVMEQQSSGSYFTRRELFHTWHKKTFPGPGGRPQCRMATCRV
jgi:hypothetical protein